jgi:hypothetical protein
MGIFKDLWGFGNPVGLWRSLASRSFINDLVLFDQILVPDQIDFEG